MNDPKIQPPKPHGKTFWDFLETWLSTRAGVAFVVVAAILVPSLLWFFAHTAAEPGGEVSLVGGAIKYTKARTAGSESLKPKNYSVRFSRAVPKINSGCPTNQPVAVTEYYDLTGDADGDKFVIIVGKTAQTMLLYKPNDGAFRTDPDRRGWTFSYCEAASIKTEYTRRFLNVLTGQLSEPIAVAVET